MTNLFRIKAHPDMVIGSAIRVVNHPSPGRNTIFKVSGINADGTVDLHDPAPAPNRAQRRALEAAKAQG